MPNAEEIRAVSRDMDEVEGTIIGFSDSGSTPRAFAVVEVIYKQTLVVPIEKLLIRNDPETAGH
jgi:hypothetical protein